MRPHPFAALSAQGERKEGMNGNGYGFTDRELTDAEAEEVCDAAVKDWKVDGRRILLLVPDHTRTCPLDKMFRRLYPRIASRAKAFDVLIALGTHQPLSEASIYERMGITALEHRTVFSKTRFFNHAWNDPAQLMSLGQISRNEIRDLTDGLFEMDVEVTCNRMIEEYDLLVILGPVFPHEVVGYSGGNKYIFPGISGPDILNFFHWLGAVITNPRIIGNKWTPVRKVLDRAAARLSIERRALCMVVKGTGLAGLYQGTAESAWSDAADLSRKIHIEYHESPYHTVLSCAPKMYDEIWVGAKCMYKLEPVVADGGTLIIYAPHIRDISLTHGRLIEIIGYHTRDYFLKQWEQYKHYPWGILAHSTHVRGIGTFQDGKETPRIQVILATQIPEDVCRRINLGYMDPEDIHPIDYQNRENQGILYVPKAGEILHRWRYAPPELGGSESS